jgi:hypothetical protein
VLFVTIFFGRKEGHEVHKEPQRAQRILKILKHEVFIICFAFISHFIDGTGWQ